MKTLALDLGPDLGWAFYDPSEKDKSTITSGAESFKKGKNDPEGVIYAKFRSWLIDQIKTFKPDCITFENVGGRWRSQYAQHYYEGMRAVLLESVYKYGLFCTSHHQMTLKKSVIGHGRASKEDVIKYVKEYYNKEVSDDEADAIMLIHHEFNIQ